MEDFKAEAVFLLASVRDAGEENELKRGRGRVRSQARGFCKNPRETRGFVPGGESGVGEEQ